MSTGDEPIGGGRSFVGRTGSAGARDGRVAGAVVLLVAAFVGIAVAKPWAVPPGPVPTPGPSLAAAAASPPPSSPSPSGRSVPSADATSTPLPLAFSLPAPSGSSPPWTGLAWRRLAPDDPLRLVTSIVHAGDGYVAIGAFGGLPTTPVWSSGDGTGFVPLPADTPTSFWPGVAILGVGAVGPTLVAVSVVDGPCGGPCATSPSPVLAWTSTDGRHWTPQVLPARWQPAAAAAAPIAAFGPAGALVASSGRRSRLAYSRDGLAWTALPPNAFPPLFALDDLAATSDGFVAIGRWTTVAGRTLVASLASPDGRRWPAAPTILPPSDTGVRPTTSRLFVGPDGIVAIGREAPRPRRVLWWRSPDGRRWSELRAFGPLGATPCAGEGCGPGPNGTLVGDGHRLVALRGGPAAAAWASVDGASWRRLTVTGDVPAGYAGAATLLPSGVLLTDGATTWFGRATTD